jgi:hypothetical protein
MSKSAASRLAIYGMLLIGLFATAYAVGEKLPGHSHTNVEHEHEHPTDMTQP